METGGGAPSPGASCPASRVLLVDDDQDVLLFINEVLTVSGYQVEMAADGAVAWEKLQSGRYDIVITDHNMPGLTGLQLVGKLRSSGMDLPVILATGKLPGDQPDQTAPLQFSAILAKPFSIQKLLETLSQVLRTAAAREKSESPLAWQGRPLFNGLRL